MTRRRIGTIAAASLGAAILAFSAAASDVERETTPAPESAMPAAPAAEAEPEPAGAGMATGTHTGPPATGRVARATFTTAVVDREPRDSVDSLPTDQTEIAFFSELHDLVGQTVTHRWEYRGEIAAEVPFEVGGPRWRVHSTKRLDPIETGRWTVSVVDGSGRVLETASFEYASVPSAPEGSSSSGEAVSPPAAPQP